MSSKERRDRAKKELKQQILRSARSLARTEGWQAVTIRKIASEIEYSAPTIYEHFESKEALLLELMLEGNRLLLSELQAVPLQTEQPEEPLFTMIRTYWNFAWEHTDFYQVMHGLGGIPFGSVETPQEAKDVFAAIREGVKQALPDETVDEWSLNDKVDMIWATVHGFITLAFNERIAKGKKRAEKVMEAAVQDLLLSWRDLK